MKCNFFANDLTLSMIQICKFKKDIFSMFNNINCPSYHIKHQLIKKLLVVRLISHSNKIYLKHPFYVSIPTYLKMFQKQNIPYGILYSLFLVLFSHEMQECRCKIHLTVLLPFVKIFITLSSHWKFKFYHICVYIEFLSTSCRKKNTNQTEKS